jgi:anti-sigma factor RsiW
MVEYPPGWTCARITLHIERYILSTLARGEALAVAEHIEACAWCAQRLTLLGSTFAARHG